MKATKTLLLCLLFLFTLSACRSARQQAQEMIRESQELRDEGEIQEAKELLLEASKVAPNYPETYLELGILYDEYLKDAQGAKPYYERFLALSSNEEMRGKVASWLKEAEEGISLPLRQVEEMPPEARELLEQRTAQYEELRRQLVNRYEGELAKLREEVAASKETKEESAKEDKTAANGLDLKADAETPQISVADLQRENAEKAAAEKLAAEKKAEADRLAAEKKAEAERLAAEKKAEADRLAAEKKAEEERLAALAKEKAEAERLKKEKQERDEKIDALVQTMVREGTLSERGTVISVSSLLKGPGEAKDLELELTEEEKETSTNTVAALPASPKEGAASSESKEQTAEKTPRYHVVEQGDNLGNISRKYYGEFRRWKDIAEANKDILPDPNKLKIGMKLVIPE